MVESILNPREKAVKRILDEAFDIFKDRNRVYGDSYKKHGAVMSAMFPSGLTLNNTEDFCRFMFISAVISKLNRYTENFDKGGHRDSSIDPINALAMMTMYDEEKKK